MSKPPDKKHPWAKFHAKPGSVAPRGEAPAVRPLSKPAAPVAPVVPAPVAAPAPRPVAPRPEAKPAPRPASLPAAKPSPTRAVARTVAAPPVSPSPVPRSPAPKTAPGSAPKSPKVAPAKPAARAGDRESAVSDDLASALASLAAEYAPLPISTAPFISVKQREVEALERRRVMRRRLGKFGLYFAGALVVAYLFISLVLFRQPPDEALQAAVEKTAQDVVLLESSGARPLEIDGAVPVLRDTLDSRHQRYYAEITLRLRQPLYAPAQTNGTLTYRVLQESLQLAREKELKFNFLQRTDGLKPPELPRLIAVLHRAGEPMVVRVPFDAEQFGWRWRIKPAQLLNRSVSRTFEGAVLDRFNDTPYLIFGTAETMPDIRDRMILAREYITSISKGVQRRADIEAVVEAPPPAEPAAPAMATPTPATGETAPQIDPNKPAVAPVKIAKPDPSQDPAP